MEPEFRVAALKQQLSEPGSLFRVGTTQDAPPAGDAGLTPDSDRFVDDPALPTDALVERLQQPEPEATQPAQSSAQSEQLPASQPAPQPAQQPAPRRAKSTASRAQATAPEPTARPRRATAAGYLPGFFQYFSAKVVQPASSEDGQEGEFDAAEA